VNAIQIGLVLVCFVTEVGKDDDLPWLLGACHSH